MADQEPLDTTSQDDDHLPERIRVHALAKRLGVTSKRILAKLSELGTEVRSPQSSVDRAVAESVRESLTTPNLNPAEPGLFDAGGAPANGVSAAAPVSEPASAPAPAGEPGTGSGQIPSIGTAPAGEPAAAPRAGAEQNAPATGATAGSGAADAVTSTAAESAEPPVSGPATTEPARGTDTPADRRADTESAASGEQTGTSAKATSLSGSPTEPGSAGTPAVPPPPAFTAANLFASPVPEVPATTEPVVFESAVVAAPLFLSPDAAAVQELRRRRKAEQETEAQPEPAESDADTDSGSDDQSEQGGDGESDDQPRRRRRGRRGRGRGRGEQQSDSEGDIDSEGSESDEDSAEEPDEKHTASENNTAKTATTASEDSAASSESTSDESGSGDDSDGGGSRRRRRRRRRKVGGDSGEQESSEDDPPNTVVHEREPRNKTRTRPASDEVQGISGSTRLEAKRQRRRDGREAGRRRPPILTESEFLARREAVDRVMVVREKEFPGHPAATQVAVLEDNILVEHFVTSTGSASMVGNVYLGKVQNVLPSMEAAFVDIGRGRNGVLYAGEVNWEAAGLGGKERKIEQALKPGTQVLVQVSKDPVGHKGARLTTQISLAGRFLVYVPGGTSTGISRKLPDTERKRLKEILREIVPADAGVIIRTASEGVSEAELTRDVERLQAAWRTITAAAAGEPNAPKTLYEEPDLLVKVVRDLFNEDFSKLVIEGERSWNTVESYIGTVAPDLLARVSRHDSTGADVFETYRIDEQLAKALDRKVWLPSGGTLVIDRTEAMTVVDVNTGKFTGSGGGNLEETVTRNNLEAAEEIVRQMRLRDIGGMIVVDFIDMVLESNRDLVLRRLTEALGRDRTRHQVSEVTSLGLVQMTRKKLGTGLVEAFSTTCEHCHGRGLLVHSYPVEAGGSEDSGGGRGRESGSRRRRNRDKPAAPAPEQAAAPAEVSEEDAAAKRAHPVALAMAAHTGDDDAHGSGAETAGQPATATAADTATGGSEAASDRATASAGTTATGSAPAAGGEAGPAPEPRRRRGRVRRSAGAAAGTSGDRPAVERNGSGAHTETATPAPAAAEPEAPGPAERVSDDGRPATVPEPAVETAPAAAAADTTVDETDVTARVPANGAAPAAPETVAPEPVETVAPEPVETVAPEPVETVAPEPVETAVAPPVETAAAAAPEADSAPAAGARRGRRRVARSTSAPAADSAGAVFVLGAQEQPPAPVADLAAEPAEAEVPARRVRRRAAGRPAGPPVDEEN
ncbi:translation initiation factor IF-2 N-terminal domain-containing protein [Nocardia sp. NPDC024068]|uniref:translation initiation factor IF-2 N-terminal domain-containing protein n=1 Tax=Nocardia sp. NPDC024068 TaxID=3157197 RepID=UPI00340CBC93